MNTYQLTMSPCCSDNDSIVTIGTTKNSSSHSPPGRIRRYGASTRRTRLERQFDPEAVRRLKAEADGDLLIGGPTLAAPALRAGLVDEISQVLLPIVIGGGLAVFPPGLGLDLELIGEQRFTGGAVALRHRVDRVRD